MSNPFLLTVSTVTAGQARGARYRRLHQGVYVESTVEDCPSLRVRGALLVQPEAVICTRTAAVLHRLPVDDDDVVHLTRGQTAPRSRRAAMKVHRLDLEPDEVIELKGFRVTSLARTLSDLASTLDLEELVAVADVVVRRAGAGAVEEAVARSWGRPGVERLREAVRLADPGADSPAETRARLRLHAAGFTRMRHGVVVRDAAGEWLAAPDLADEVARVAVQHDGADHFAKGVKQRVHDAARDELTRGADWEVVVSTAVEDAQPDRLLANVTAAYLRSARRLGPAVLPDFLRAA